MKAVLSEKELVEEEVRSLQGNLEYYKTLVSQLQDKVGKYKLKCSNSKRRSDGKLASSL